MWNCKSIFHIKKVKLLSNEEKNLLNFLILKVKPHEKKTFSDKQEKKNGKLVKSEKLKTDNQFWFREYHGTIEQIHRFAEIVFIPWK